MSDVTRRFRWGASVLAILHHFSTPEVKGINRTCKKAIKDFTNPELEGEGYRAAIIPLEMHEYGFVLGYSFEAEEWVLEVYTFPDWDSPDCKRRRPKEPGKGGKGKNKRDANGEGTEARRPDLAWLTEKLSELYKTHEATGFGPMLNAFWGDTRTMRGLRGLVAQVRRNPIPHHAREHVSLVIQKFRILAEQQSQGCNDVVQLVRCKVDEALGYLRPFSSFQQPRAHRINRDVLLWDSALFGALPE